MNKYIKYWIIIPIIFGGVLFSQSSASAACQLTDTYPEVQLNKAGVAPSFANYATGETVIATVKTKQGFDCNGTQVQFMLCPVPGSSGADCGMGKVISTVSITDGSAAATWPATQFNNFSNFRIKAAAGTDNPNAGTSWQYYTDQFSVLGGSQCGVTNFTALQSGNLINFNVTANASCEGKAVNVELLIQSSNLGTSSGGTVASGKITSGKFSGSWPLNTSLGVVYFKACITGGTCQTSTTSGTPPGGGSGTSGGTGGCGTPGQPACAPGSTQTTSFEITNPLKGGVTDFTSLVKIIAQWIFNLAIPIAVAMIVYSGILFLTAAGEPAKVTKAKEVLTYAVIGLAIIMIGSGFVTLIQSILELGGTGTTQEQGPELPVGPNLCNNGVCANGVVGPCQSDADCQQAPSVGAVGNKCSKDSNCFSGLKCKNTICQRVTGNFVGEACVGGANCAVGLNCDLTSEGKVFDDPTLGSCFQVPSTAIIITIGNIPTAIVGQAYTMNMSVTGGGSDTLSWSVVGGTLPPGLSLSVFGTSAGNTISGIPSTAGTYVFVLNAKNDTTGQSGGKSVTIKVNKP